MNLIMKQIVNHKVNSITPEELLELSNQYQIPLNLTQAQQVVSILRSEKINVGNTQQVHRLLNRLQTEIDAHVADVVRQLMQQFNQYL